MKLDSMPPALRRKAEEALVKEAKVATAAPRKLTNGLQKPTVSFLPRSLKPTVVRSPKGRLTLFFPGLVLMSVNQMIGSKVRGNHAKAKADVRNALLEFVMQTPPPELFRFDEEVDIRFLQEAPGKGLCRIDSQNLWVKPLLDGLTKRGLGVIEDDSRKHVRMVTTGSNPQVELGVRVFVERVRGKSKKGGEV